MIHERAGMKTSEFWLIIMFFVAVLANATSFFTIPSDQMMLLAALAGVYKGGRFMLKRETAKQPGPYLPAPAETGNMPEGPPSRGAAWDNQRAPRLPQGSER